MESMEGDEIRKEMVSLLGLIMLQIIDKESFLTADLLKNKVICIFILDLINNLINNFFYGNF